MSVDVAALADKAETLLGPLKNEALTGLTAASQTVTSDLPYDMFVAVVEELQRRQGLKVLRPVTWPEGDKTTDFNERVTEELDRLRVRDTAVRMFRDELHPPADPPPIRTLRERLADPPTEIEWRVEGWQPLGTRVMLAAQFKAGKTTLTGNLARSLVDGSWWLETAAVTKVNTGTVTIVDFEMSERQIDGWLKDQGIKNDDQIMVIPLRGRSSTFDIIDEKVRTQWAERLTGTEYLILDCLRPILDALGLDEHRDGGRFLTAFDALCVETGISDTLVVHHMGHIAERSRGDSRFRDWPDVEWRLVREADDPASPRYISAYGRDVDVTESELKYDSDTRHLRVVGGNRAQTLARRALDDILSFLENTFEPVGKSAVELGVLEMTSHARSAVRAGLAMGIRDGLIYREKGAKNAQLLTLKPPVRQSSPKESANGQVSSPNPIEVGELDDPLADTFSTPQFAAAETFVSPEDDPW